MCRLAILFFGVLALFSGYDSEADVCPLEWKTYCDSTATWCALYPSRWFTPSPQATGQRTLFINKAREERLRIGRTENRTIDGLASEAALRKLYILELQQGYFVPSLKRRILTSYRCKDGFTIYGTVGDDEFCLRIIPKGNAFCYAYLHFTGCWIKLECESEVISRLLSSFH